MSPRVLNMTVGAGLQLEPASGGGCYLVELLGYKTEQSLMVTPPYGADGQPVLKEGDEVAIRYQGGEGSYAFRSRVVQVCDHPYPYLHLTYPAGVEGALTRRGTRVEVDGPTMSLAMLDGGEQLSVVMADISIHGARLISPKRLGDVGERFTIEMPNNDEPDSESISLPCTIRHIQSQFVEYGEPRVVFHHGVEFAQLEQSAQLFIARFMRNNIMRQRNH